HVRSRASEDWRSAGEAKAGVTNFLGVHTDERARNGDLGKNSSSSERGGGAGRKTSLGNERGTTASKAAGVGGKDRAKGGADSESRLDWRGGWVGGGTGERGTSGRAADGAAGLRLVRSVVSRRRRWRRRCGGRGDWREGVGWVGARVDAGLLAAQPTGPGPLVYDAQLTGPGPPVYVVAVGLLGGGARLARGGGWGTGGRGRAVRCARKRAPKKGSQQSARAVSFTGRCYSLPSHGSNLIIEKLPKIRTRTVRSLRQFPPWTSSDSPARGLSGDARRGLSDDARGGNWRNDLYLFRPIELATIPIARFETAPSRCASDCDSVQKGPNSTPSCASGDLGATISPLANTDRKGGAFPIMHRQFLRAVGVTAATGNAALKLSRPAGYTTCAQQNEKQHMLPI
ncbi:hypothetical protein THAOC_34715, partial [Thalassiosira oceanica]